ncbi:rod shape-determining protein MreC [Croceiramulus getboli]|nr:rod shape-determining protein MreC [Flavobacteriaceae bacterium YJPT1-3]
MQRIINFLINNRNFLLFVVLLSISFIFTIQSHSYHRSRFVNSANFLSGGIYERVNNISSYFELKEINEQLVEENVYLRSLIHNPNDSIQARTDTTTFGGKFRFVPARVINNNYARSSNYLTLRGGEQDSIKPDLGVITPQGIVGIVDKVSDRYSTVISILNSSSRINAKLKKSEHFGTLVWDGVDPNIVQLIDVQQQAPVQQGDTIVTGGKSTIFPKDIGIGIVQGFMLDQSENFYTISIRLFNDMTNLGPVYVIENLDASEILQLEQETEDEQ